MLPDVLVVVLTADLFDHQAQQQETIVAVLPAAPGFEGQVALAVKREVIFERAKLQAMRVEFRAEEIARASGVSEQMMNGDLGSDVLVRVIGKIFSQWIGELQLARLH